MEACVAYTVQVPNKEYRWSWTNVEGICRRKAQKGAYSAHSPELGVAGTHIDYVQNFIWRAPLGPIGAWWRCGLKL